MPTETLTIRNLQFVPHTTTLGWHIEHNRTAEYVADLQPETIRGAIPRITAHTAFKKVRCSETQEAIFALVMAEAQRVKAIYVEREPRAFFKTQKEADAYDERVKKGETVPFIDRYPYPFGAWVDNGVAGRFVSYSKRGTVWIVWKNSGQSMEKFTQRFINAAEVAKADPYWLTVDDVRRPPDAIQVRCQADIDRYMRRVKQTAKNWDEEAVKSGVRLALDDYLHTFRVEGEGDYERDCYGAGAITYVKLQKLIKQEYHLYGLTENYGTKQLVLDATIEVVGQYWATYRGEDGLWTDGEAGMNQGMDHEYIYFTLETDGTIWLSSTAI